MKRILLAAFFFVGLTGMQAKPYYGPNGNGTLDHKDDARWAIFHDAKIATDEARGTYEATFGRALAQLDGKSFTISGYMLPVQTSLRAAHFVLTRRSTGCPFCPPNEPTEAIEVFALAPVGYTRAPITVEGELHLVGRADTGLFYRIDQAKVMGGGWAY